MEKRLSLKLPQTCFLGFFHKGSHHESLIQVASDESLRKLIKRGGKGVAYLDHPTFLFQKNAGQRART